MFSTNVNMTHAVHAVLFGRKDRTPFDYVSSRNPGATLGITCPCPEGYKRFVLLYTIDAIDPAETHPETFRAVFAVRSEGSGSHFALATLTSDLTAAHNWSSPRPYKVEQIYGIETLQPSTVEEQQMWLGLRKLIDLALERAAAYVEVVVESSKLVTAGIADLIDRMAADRE